MGNVSYAVEHHFITALSQSMVSFEIMTYFLQELKKQLEELLFSKNDLTNSLTLITGEKSELEENKVELKTKYEKVAHELAEVNQRNKVKFSYQFILLYHCTLPC